MITWNETQILTAIVGMVGLLSSFAVVSRGFRANDKFEHRLKKLAVCEVCNEVDCVCQ